MSDSTAKQGLRAVRIHRLRAKDSDLVEGPTMANQLESLVETIKSKVRALKKPKKTTYIKMDKSSSVRVEIRSRKARKLIDKTLKVADRPGKRTIS